MRSVTEQFREWLYGPTCTIPEPAKILALFHLEDAFRAGVVSGIRETLLEVKERDGGG